MMPARSPKAVLVCDVERLRLDVLGAVQGVGFRPFVYRLACAEELHGFVRNTGEGVRIEIEGMSAAMARFLTRLEAELPPRAVIQEQRTRRLAPTGDRGFVVAPSDLEGAPSAPVMPDLATCPDCLREILDPTDRRFVYPFTTCMHCGPRYSILRSLPYDRERTAMDGFPLCDACRTEYQDPSSRRFHAEAIACPDCGPQLALWDRGGREVAVRAAALRAAVDALRCGLIVAVKGLGGYQLLVAACNEAAVQRLRQRKRRPRKPLALMFPSLRAAEAVAQISALESALLLSPESPIVLLRAKLAAASLAPSIAPANPYLGIMLPYTPLHHLLLREYALPMVATSGNSSDEPMVTRDDEALQRLSGVADCFLVHNRPILRAVDDSIMRVMAGRELILRRARGYAPMAIRRANVQTPLLALGGQQKNTLATGFGGQIFLGPHVGDLSGSQARRACDRMASELTALHGLEPAGIACDAHPNYYTSRVAERYAVPIARVPHHLAHVLSCMVDNELEGPMLGVAWDGTGYGGDNTVWGGEFLRLDTQHYRRFGHLQSFALPGGEAAIREPRRCALGALYALFGADAFGMTELAAVASFAPEMRIVLAAMLARGINSPLTSSAGRLFDALASMLDLCQSATFEGEAAMAVEFAAERAGVGGELPTPVLIEQGRGYVIDWRPMLRGLIAKRGKASSESLAAAVHDSLAQSIVAVAERAGTTRVLLTGGCFQNARLTECAVGRLRAAGFEPYWHRRIPPNDGGLAAGQIAFAARPLCQEAD